MTNPKQVSAEPIFPDDPRTDDQRIAFRTGLTEELLRELEIAQAARPDRR